MSDRHDGSSANEGWEPSRECLSFVSRSPTATSRLQGSGKSPAESGRKELGSLLGRESPSQKYMDANVTGTVCPGLPTSLLFFLVELAIAEQIGGLAGAQRKPATPASMGA